MWILIVVQIHARLGEVLYVCGSSPDGDARLAGKSVQHFCRSIELCDDYLRGFYGLILVRWVDEARGVAALLRRVEPC